MSWESICRLSCADCILPLIGLHNTHSFMVAAIEEIYDKQKRRKDTVRWHLFDATFSLYASEADVHRRTYSYRCNRCFQLWIFQNDGLGHRTHTHLYRQSYWIRCTSWGASHRNRQIDVEDREKCSNSKILPSIMDRTIRCWAIHTIKYNRQSCDYFHTHLTIKTIIFLKYLKAESEWLCHRFTNSNSKIKSTEN